MVVSVSPFMPSTFTEQRMFNYKGDKYGFFERAKIF